MSELIALSETELNMKRSEVSLKRKIGALLLILSIIMAFTIPVSAQDVQLKGIDVSSHQGAIDWAAVKSAGTDFAMIRDGFGGDGNTSIWDSQTDAYFEQNYSEATQNGVKVGVYHYSCATTVTMASQEADECLHILNGRHLDYPVAYDVEDPSQYGLSSDTLGQMAQTFCSKIQAAGYKVMVYTNVNFYNNHLPSSLKDQYDTWIAHYTDASAPNFDKYTMWQYSNAGHVSGITGQGGDTSVVDLDYSYVDYAGNGGSGGSGTGTTPLDPMTFQSDTSSYTFKDNSTYTYKITTPDTLPPTAKSSNPSAVTVSGPTQTYNGFLFTLTNVGAGDATITTTAGDGRSVSFTATGTGTAEAMRCDTSSYTFGTNSTYYYKITTAASSAPSAVSSNSSVVSVSYAGKLSDGYLYRINNIGKGSAVITTKTANGTSVSFTAVGTGAMRCDTSSYRFGSGKTYYYKVWSSDSSAPRATSSNSSAVSVSYAKKLSDGYLYRISKTGKGSAVITTTARNGSSVSFQAS